MDKDFGVAEPQDLQDIYYIHSKVDEAKNLLANPQVYSNETLTKSYMATLLNILLESQVQEKRWWDMATRKYKLDGNITIDFFTGKFSLVSKTN